MSFVKNVEKESESTNGNFRRIFLWINLLILFFKLGDVTYATQQLFPLISIETQLLYDSLFDPKQWTTENEDKLFAFAKLIFPPVIEEHPSVDFDMLNGVGEIEPDSDDDGYFDN